MTPEEYIKLYEKYISGTCNAGELKQLTDYQDEFEAILPPDPERPDDKAIRDRIFRKIEKTLKSDQKVIRRKLFLWPAAAALLIAFGIGAILLGEKKSGVVITETSRKSEQISPGSNKATLTLSNGSIINLGDAENGVLANQAGVRISKTTDGKLIYKADSNPSASTDNKFNTITTPAGGQYQIILPDGSNVWLNAASSLTYPVHFGEAKRVVRLEGEAYFEVAPNKKRPFKVNTSNQTVEVLGTHFNIEAYHDEPLVKTTLLEGSIKVTHADKAQAMILKPGQQSRQVNNLLTVTDVEAADAIAWKNGYFIFDRESIYSIMRKISRWYNVDVAYEKGFTDKNFWGSISRDSDINDILRKLELTKTIKFKLNGRRITVMR